MWSVSSTINADRNIKGHNVTMHSYVSHIQDVEYFEVQIQFNLRTIKHVVVGTVTFQTVLY